MPEHDMIELWDISVLDSFNKQRAPGGHQGHGFGQLRSTGGWEEADMGEVGDGRGHMRRQRVIVMSADVKFTHRWL